MQIIISDVSVSENDHMFGTSSVQTKLKEISEEDLGRQLQDFFLALSKTLADLPHKCGSFTVDELQVLVEISASGGIQLVGKVDAGVKGGLSIKLKRADT